MMHSPGGPQLAEALQILLSLERRVTALEESTMFTDRDHGELRASVDGLYQSLLRVERSLGKLSARLDSIQQAQGESAPGAAEDAGDGDQHAS